MVFEGFKTAEGAPMPPEGFKFGIFDEGGSLIETVSNESDGRIVFPPITFDHEGTFDFTIRKLTPSGNGWTTDTREYRAIITVTDDEMGNLIAIVTVTDNGEGKLVTQVDYPEGHATFTNTYETKSICIPLSALKIAIGAPLHKDQFTFGVFDEEGREVASAKNNAPGEIDIPQ